MAYVQERNGRYRMFWRSADLKTGKMKLRSKNFTGEGGKSAALKEARLQEAQDTRRPAKADDDLTITEFLAIWEEERTSGVTDATKKNIRYSVEKINLWVGDTKLRKISGLTALNLQRQSRSSNLAPLTRRRIHSTFKKMIKAAVAWEHLPVDALKVLEAFDPIRVRKQTPELRSIEESKKLACELRERYPNLADMITIAAYTGLRYSEIAALSIDQFDLRRKTLRVDRTVIRTKSGFEVANTPKTEAGARTVPISPEVAEVVHRHRTAPSGPFLLNSGTLYHPSTASSRIKKVAQALGVPSGFHCSRHYWCSLLIDRAVPLPKIAALMGHASTKVTMEEYAWCLGDPSSDDLVLDILSDLGEDGEGSVWVARS